MQHHKYSLTEIENMMPWEREVYTTLLMQHLEDERTRERQRQMDKKQINTIKEREDGDR